MLGGFRFLRTGGKHLQKMNALQIQMMAPRAAQVQRLTPFVMGTQHLRGFRQVHDLHEVVYTTQEELAGRTAKYLERTDKVYKPS
jgi:hypothetical protein